MHVSCPSATAMVSMSQRNSGRATKRVALVYFNSQQRIAHTFRQICVTVPASEHLCVLNLNLNIRARQGKLHMRLSRLSFDDYQHIRKAPGVDLS